MMTSKRRLRLELPALLNPVSPGVPRLQRGETLIIYVTSIIVLRLYLSCCNAIGAWGGDIDKKLSFFLLR